MILMINANNDVIDRAMYKQLRKAYLNMKEVVDKNQENVIKGILHRWKTQMRAVLDTYVYVREIPNDGADGLTIQKFREDCKIHLAVNSCVTYGYLS